MSETMKFDYTPLVEAAKKATQDEWFCDGDTIFVDSRYQACCGRAGMECCGNPDVLGEYGPLGRMNPLDAAYAVAAQPKHILAWAATTATDRAEAEALREEVRGLREALETIAEEHDTGRHDGVPEACPAHDADTMFAIARAALERGR